MLTKAAGYQLAALIGNQRQRGAGQPLGSFDHRRTELSNILLQQHRRCDDTANGGEPLITALAPQLAQPLRQLRR